MLVHEGHSQAMQSAAPQVARFIWHLFLLGVPSYFLEFWVIDGVHSVFEDISVRHLWWPWSVMRLVEGGRDKRV